MTAKQNNKPHKSAVSAVRVTKDQYAVLASAWLRFSRRLAAVERLIGHHAQR